ncbi:MerR family transcriptional regulator [Kineococcus aurantiacus]|uniref:DNA-binding transcriptional MerR regulator n=1 Tax=Kineococcus aurantiacus TaxID=37633 RepID=A0A7Y9DQN8_9ACTN|nr:MerR family transcriptional regulator [Kineococcus aurantiacus]NYD24947.1 DNA-binding transcriptional MerR regulator [Kineococcus aurantiacus]
MRIGQLSRRTGVSTRMLRYYEQQRLLSPRRGANGYREYAEADVERIEQISHLVRAGLGTRLVRAVLDMGLASGDEPVQGWSPTCTAAVADDLQGEFERLEASLVCLTRSRDTVRRYLQEVTVVRSTSVA